MLLHKELIKELDKIENSNCRNTSNFFIFEGADDYHNIGISDGHFIKFYNENHFYIDIKKYPFHNVAPIKAETFTTGAREALTVANTNDYRKIDKREVHALLLPDGRRVWYDTKFEKYFNENKYFNFETLEKRGTTPNSPIYLYAKSGDLIGVIMPIKVND